MLRAVGEHHGAGVEALEFWSSVIDSLAWPVGVVIAALLLRKPFTDLLADPSTKHVKAGPGGLEIEKWDQRLADARQEIEASPVPPGEAQPAADEELTFGGEMFDLATVSPSAAILESFAVLERLLRQLVRIEPGTRRPDGRLIITAPSVRVLARMARKQGLLTDEETYAIEDLSVLRNVVAHEHADIDVDRARDYVILVSRLVATLNAHARDVDATDPPNSDPPSDR